MRVSRRAVYAQLVRICALFGAVTLALATAWWAGIVDPFRYEEHGHMPIGTPVYVRGVSYYVIHLSDGSDVAVNGLFLEDWNSCEGYLLSDVRVFYLSRDRGTVVVFVSRSPPITRTSFRTPIRIPIIPATHTWETFPLCTGLLVAEPARAP